MSFSEIPITDTESSFKIRTVLESIELVLRFDWNSRMEIWHLSILDSAETNLLMGLPMYVNRELISRFKINGLPPGRLMLYDASDTITECGRDDLGSRCKLIYEDSSDA